MKRIFLSLIMPFLMTAFSYAQWSTGTGTIFPTNSSDQVGIGTAAPVFMLDVRTPGGGPQINVQAAATSNGSIHYSTLLGNWSLGVGCGTAENVFNLTNEGAEVLRVTANGNVGIGTTSPNAPLEVNGNIRNSSPTQFVFTNNVDVISSSSDASLFPSSANARVLIAAGISTGTVKIGPSVGGIAVLGSSLGGFVGVGTASPDEMLTVNGTIHSTEVRVTSVVPYPDYVFKPSYRLPKLSEIKAYIDRNHHLPEVPTEAEVAKNGLKVGQSEILLLKKVEELTLYLIEQQKINNSLLKRINKLESKSSHKRIAK